MEGLFDFPQTVNVPPQVFKKAYIPRTLTEVSHYERDVDLMKLKEEESAISGHNDNVSNTKTWKQVESVETVEVTDKYFSYYM